MKVIVEDQNPIVFDSGNLAFEILKHFKKLNISTNFHKNDRKILFPEKALYLSDSN